MFCNCKFHFFRGSYIDVYIPENSAIEKKYVPFKEYKNVDKVRYKWRTMVLNYNRG